VAEPPLVLGTPEPATIALCGAAGVALLLARKRRKA